MESKPYHHGDLRRLLIETGIECIRREGEEKLSLRRVAAECGVSNAAPYAHFAGKDAFIGAIQRHITDLFTAALEETAQKYADSPALLSMLGKTYVLFFYKNPFYYDFLFSRKNMKVSLLLQDTGKDGDLPLGILKRAVVGIFSKTGLPEKMIQDKVIALWALVHGLSAIAIMPGIEYDESWEARIEQIITSISYCPSYENSSGEEK